MKVKTIVCGPLDVNCYVLYSDETKECCAIDPAAAEPVLKFIRENELICTHILLTHGHFDHIGGVAQLKKETGAKVCIHKDDAGMLISDHESFAVVANRHIEPAPADICFSGGESLKI
ncbi:MBL fold metallo-hydrolase, partial [Eubacteriales bacterium OttesenSCG-928-K08]|nr:MBL fold metallo-hydrolase [Eubacteriales bacterium OttesenSCG-928-K08]